MATKPPFLQGKRARRFEALQACLVPRARHFTAAQRKQSLELINRILRSQPPQQLKKLSLFFTIVDIWSLCMTGHLFKGLNPARQEALLHQFYNSPIGLMRKGFWGLSTLAKLGVYGQSSVYADLHYLIPPIK